MAVRSRAGEIHRQTGFTYLGLLVAVALIGLGLVGASEVWTTIARRQKLEQLEFVGQQFVQAIGSYYESTPGPVKRYPRTLSDLLEDRRSPVVRRHLRQVYLNPLSGRADWEVIAASDGGVAGVRAVMMASGDSGERTFEYRYAGQLVQ